MKEIASSIIVAAGMISAAIYFRPASPPLKYSMVAVDSLAVMYRLNSKTGTLAKCVGNDCGIVTTPMEDPNSN